MTHPSRSLPIAHHVRSIQHHDSHLISAPARDLRVTRRERQSRVSHLQHRVHALELRLEQSLRARDVPRVPLHQAHAPSARDATRVRVLGVLDASRRLARDDDDARARSEGVFASASARARGNATRIARARVRDEGFDDARRRASRDFATPRASRATREARREARRGAIARGATRARAIEARWRGGRARGRRGRGRLVWRSRSSSRRRGASRAETRRAI
jgi:hypothetical protein